MLNAILGTATRLQAENLRNRSIRRANWVRVFNQLDSRRLQLFVKQRKEKIMQEDGATLAEFVYALFDVFCRRKPQSGQSAAVYAEDTDLK